MLYIIPLLIAIFIAILTSWKARISEPFVYTELTESQKKIIADIKNGKRMFKDILKMDLSKDDLKAIITYYSSSSSEDDINSSL